jgi:hypothetical protein
MLPMIEARKVKKTFFLEKKKDPVFGRMPKTSLVLPSP